MVVGRHQHPARRFSLYGAILLLASVGCDGDGGTKGTTTPSMGGAIGTGGDPPGTGGATSPNGSGGQAGVASGTGGATQATTPAGSGGSQAAGGATSSGGKTSTGGTQGTGGRTAAGGTQGKGGAVAAGGSESTGGRALGGAQGTGGSMSAGGAIASGGALSTGGAKSTGGAQSTGGTRSTGGAQGTGGSTENPNAIGPTKTCGCLTSSGNYSGNPLTATIVVNDGETYDGGCKTYTTKSLASGGLGDGSQEENQKPLFRVNAGGKLINVILGAPAADGVHFYGNATAQNIHWLDIGEDAATIKDDATVTLDCGSAKNGSDKVFQVNAKATWNISNFTIKGAGKAMRENGDKCYPITAVFDHCDISDLDEVIFRTDCTSSKVTISNTRYSGLGDGLVMVGSTIYNSSSGNVTITNVQKY